MTGASGGRAVCARSNGAAVHSKIASRYVLFPITGTTSINDLLGGIPGKRASLVAACQQNQ